MTIQTKARGCMTPEETKNDIELAETLDVVQEAPAEQPQENEQPTKAVPAPEKEESMQAIRFKTLREAREQAERERDELRQQIERMRATEKVQPTPQQEQQDFSIAPDDLVEGKHLTKYDREIQSLKKQLESYHQQASVASVETRLKTQYADFDSVVSKENIEVLRTAYPEIAATINSSPDLYNKAVAAYTMIKKFGIVSDSSYDSQKAKAQANASKPRPIASINAQQGSDSPLTHANAFAEGLTSDVKAQLYREMLEAKKRRS
jgi:hypothetical protein